MAYQPAADELEAITVGWLRDGMGLPADFDGVYNDTASMSSIAALAAARQNATGDAARRGLGDGPRLRFYTSEEAHSSIDRAAMLLGLGRDGSRHIPTDGDRAIIPEALAQAIREDRAATTTATTAIDPVDHTADICAYEGSWLHVDAAYAGPAALIAEQRHHFSGWERADSIIMNPHKSMFTPVDGSLLRTRRMDTLRDALSLVPEYLRTVGDEGGRNYSEDVPQLGRRGRAIKMWVLLRYLGLSGIRARLQVHLDMTAELVDWIDAEPDAQRLAEAPFSLVCFRWRPNRYPGREEEPEAAAAVDQFNERLMTRLNELGDIFISHTRIDGHVALRIAIGNIRTEQRHIVAAWDQVRHAAAELDATAA